LRIAHETARIYRGALRGDMAGRGAGAAADGAPHRLLVTRLSAIQFGEELARLGWVEDRNRRTERGWSSDIDAACLPAN
jgi:hypothetical protein